MSNKKTVYIAAMDHFDLVWRRAFDRDIEWKGQNFVCYADLEEYYIKDSIELCKKYPMYNFKIECVMALEKFLERNPDYEETVKEYIKSGRIYVPFSGINIIDSNLVGGESIVRNFLYGYQYLKDTYDVEPDGMDRNDAFGNSAQLPQIARKFGTKWMYHITYSNCDKNYWRGLDGSIVYDMKPTGVGNVGGYLKYRPCPVCKGFKDKHCDYCNDRRIDEKFMEKVKFPLNVDEEKIQSLEIPGYIYANGEEVMPSEDVVKWAIENKDKYNIEFINVEKYVEHYKKYIDNADSAPEDDIMQKQECNCNNTGCYVTRIKIKQMVRKLENSIAAAEALAISAYIEKKTYPYDELRHIWNNLLFGMFHDAVAATIVDEGYYEICDYLNEAQELCDKIIREYAEMSAEKKADTVTVYNPYGIKLSTEARVVLDSGYALESAVICDFEEKDGKMSVCFETGEIEPFGTKTFKIVKDSGKYQRNILYSEKAKVTVGAGVLTNEDTADTISSGTADKYTIENEYYKIEAVNEGIVSIFDKRLNKVVAQKSEYMVGEWILEHDEGSPWATLSPDLRRFPLSQFTEIKGVENTPDYQRITFGVVPGVIDGYAVSGMFFSYSVTLSRKSRLIKFSADVKWDTQNHRIRLAFPTEIKGKHLYEIPYGTIEREPYEPNILFEDGRPNWASAAGDYPVANWAGVDGEDVSFVLFNRGTPSYQINTDKLGKENIYMSILRSPSVGTYLHSPLEYSMTDYDGMRDAGEHHFEYAVSAYQCSVKNSSVVADGIGYNAVINAIEGDLKMSELPEVLEDNSRISAVMPAHDKSGIIIRAAEYRGKESSLTIKLPSYVKKAYETDMKENIISEIEIKDGLAVLSIGCFEIKTILLK